MKNVLFIFNRINLIRAFQSWQGHRGQRRQLSKMPRRGEIWVEVLTVGPE